VVADRLGIPERLAAAAPPSSAPALARTESVLAEVVEAAIGACFLTFGFDETAPAVIEAFEPEIAEAMVGGLDFKSELQERLARRGELVTYEVVSEDGPPHERSFGVAAMIGGEEAGRGVGGSKKDAEQAAAQAVLEAMDEA
jgi:ribonuclease-3